MKKAGPTVRLFHFCLREVSAFVLRQAQPLRTPPKS